MNNFKSKLKQLAECILILAAVLMVVWVGIAGAAWQWRNPKANQTTFWTEMPAPLRFERMEKYR